MYEPVKFSRFHLPRRTDAPVAPGHLDGIDTHPALVQALADRIGSLPGISCYPVAAVNISRSLRFYMDSEFTLETSADAPVLFADLDPAGRVSLGVSPDHEAEIIRSGWGKPEGSRISTLPPRDTADVTILWRITLMSYFELASRNNFDVWREFRTAARTIPSGPATGSPGLVPGAFF
jgi:hypothetical protein